MFDFNRLIYDKNGLIPAIVTDCGTGEVLMFAYMNKESLAISIKEGRTCFWSRSRGELWRKGETSGNVQHIVSIKTDCDLDALKISVKKDGPACHTGAESCFYENVYDADADEAITGNASVVDADTATSGTGTANSGGASAITNAVNPAVMASAAVNTTSVVGAAGTSAATGAAGEHFTLGSLYDIIADRKTNAKPGSYTTYLFEKGIDKILKKLGEESTEVIIAGKAGDKAETIYEIGDLAYHAMVLMVEMGISTEDVMKELASRHVIDKKVKQEKMT